MTACVEEGDKEDGRVGSFEKDNGRRGKGKIKHVTESAIRSRSM